MLKLDESLYGPQEKECLEKLTNIVEKSNINSYNPMSLLPPTKIKEIIIEVYKFYSKEIKNLILIFLQGKEQEPATNLSKNQKLDHQEYMKKNYRADISWLIEKHNYVQQFYIELMKKSKLERSLRYLQIIDFMIYWQHYNRILELQKTTYEKFHGKLLENEDIYKKKQLELICNMLEYAIIKIEPSLFQRMFPHLPVYSEVLFNVPEIDLKPVITNLIYNKI